MTDNRRLQTTAAKIAAAGLLAALQVASASRAHAIDFNRDCTQVIETEVSASDEMRQGEAMAATRTRVILMASQSAIRQTLGNQVSARSGYELQSHNTDIDEKLFNRIRSQAAGFVKLDITGESTGAESGREMLHLTGRAAVCVPKTPLLVKDVIRVVSAVNIDGHEAAEFREALLDVMSGSPNFLISDIPDDSIDMEISGRINRIEWTGAGKSLPADFPGAAVRATPATTAEFQRLSVGITVDARRVEDGAIITVALDRSKNFPAAADARRVAPGYVRDMLKEAAVELRDKLTELKINEASPGMKPRPKPGSGEW
jgi:hypothetical protein